MSAKREAGRGTHSRKEGLALCLEICGHGSCVSAHRTLCGRDARGPSVMNLKGKTAIVTGGTRGIGRGIAEALVRSLSNVCISGRSRDEVDRVVKELEDLDEGRVTGTVCDVRVYDQVKALLAFAVSELGGVDILVNNAGIGIFESVEEMSPENFRGILETKLF